MEEQIRSSSERKKGKKRWLEDTKRRKDQCTISKKHSKTEMRQKMREAHSDMVRMRRVLVLLRSHANMWKIKSKYVGLMKLCVLWSDKNSCSK